MLRIVRGARLDMLLDAMLAALERSPLPLPAREIVVVQGRGLDRWISQQAALRRGGWGLAETLFPRPFLLRAFAAVCDGAAPPRRVDDGWTRLELELAIAAMLPELAQDARFTAVAAAMRGTAARASIHDAALECAPSIAHVLDRCAQHRVELVEAWTRGGDESGKADQGADGGTGARARGARAESDADGVSHRGGGAECDELWLAELWRRVAAKHAPSRLIIDRGRFMERCRSERGVPPGLPPRVSVFGVSTLAPSFLELLAALAKRIEVTIYAIDPCPGWAVTHGGAGGVAAQTETARPGAPHPLAVAWGVEALEFEALAARLAAKGDARLEPLSPMRAEGSMPASALARLQARLRGDTSGTVAEDLGSVPDSMRDGCAVDAHDDDSLQFLCCAGSLDEVERVYAAIVALLERDPSLQPRDIAILTPDLAAYGPRVEAVFGSRRDAQGRLIVPFAVADRDREWTDLAQTLSRLVKTALGRCQRSAVLELLAESSIGSTFGIDAAGLDRIAAWTQAARIRWGIDAAHRAVHGRPGETIGTWEWGLDRLRLGSVMAEGACGALGVDEPVAPLMAVEEGDLELLESLSHFIAALGELAKRAGESMPLVSAAGADDWLTVVERLIDRCLFGAPDARASHAGHGAHGLAMLRLRLGEIREAAIAAGFVEPRRIRARSAMAYILERVSAEHPGRALLASGVTVALLQPMRSIPFRVIALVGMAAGAIPRRESHPSFDLVARKRREGDRDARLDDRQVMLETVMAASRSLIIAWPGVDPSSGLEQPPSTVVSELMEVVSDALKPSRAAEPREDGAAVSVRMGDRTVAEPTPSVASPSDLVVMSMESLERFWRSPPAAYLSQRRVRTERDDRDVSEEDPIDREFERELRGLILGLDEPEGELPPAQPRVVGLVELMGHGVLPRGVTGPKLARRMHTQVMAWRDEAELLVRVLGARDGLRSERRPISIELDADLALASCCDAKRIRLEGGVPVLAGIGPVFLPRSLSVDDPRSRWRGWLRLLACAAAQGAHEDLQGLLMLGCSADGKGEEREFKLAARLIKPPPPAEARAMLAAFASLARHGLCEALAFMPVVAHLYAHHCTKDDPTPEQALALAREAFLDEGDGGTPAGEGTDTAVRILFGPERFFDPTRAPSFETLAKALALPMLRAFKDGGTNSTLRTRAAAHAAVSAATGSKAGATKRAKRSAGA